MKKVELKCQPMLRSDLCDFSDAFIVVKGDITVTSPNNANKKQTKKKIGNN